MNIARQTPPHGPKNPAFPSIAAADMFGVKQQLSGILESSQNIDGIPMARKAKLIFDRGIGSLSIEAFTAKMDRMDTEYPEHRDVLDPFVWGCVILDSRNKQLEQSNHQLRSRLNNIQASLRQSLIIEATDCAGFGAAPAEAADRPALATFLHTSNDSSGGLVLEPGNDMRSILPTPRHRYQLHAESETPTNSPTSPFQPSLVLNLGGISSRSHSPGRSSPGSVMGVGMGDKRDQTRARAGAAAGIPGNLESLSKMAPKGDQAEEDAFLSQPTPRLRDLIPEPCSSPVFSRSEPLPAVPAFAMPAAQQLGPQKEDSMDSLLNTLDTQDFSEDIAMLSELASRSEHAAVLPTLPELVPEACSSPVISRSEPLPAALPFTTPGTQQQASAQDDFMDTVFNTFFKNQQGIESPTEVSDIEQEQEEEDELSYSALGSSRDRWSHISLRRSHTSDSAHSRQLYYGDMASGDLDAQVSAPLLSPSSLAAESSSSSFVTTPSSTRSAHLPAARQLYQQPSTSKTGIPVSPVRPTQPAAAPARTTTAAKSRRPTTSTTTSTTRSPSLRKSSEKMPTPTKSSQLRSSTEKVSTTSSRYSSLRSSNDRTPPAGASQLRKSSDRAPMGGSQLRSSAERVPTAASLVRSSSARARTTSSQLRSSSERAPTMSQLRSSSERFTPAASGLRGSSDRLPTIPSQLRGSGEGLPPGSPQPSPSPSTKLSRIPSLSASPKPGAAAEDAGSASCPLPSALPGSTVKPPRGPSRLGSGRK